MAKLNEMLEGYEIPKMAKVRQLFDRTLLENPEEKLIGLLRGKNLPIQKGDRIAITGSSRGIAEYQRIMRTAVAYVKEKGGIPFIVPAMGSHGGGTAEGQEAMLRELGITEAAVGAPIISCMDVVEVARTELGLPVYIDKNAVEADGILLLNRVKTHTSIREKYQSGLIKMMAIGLAKHKGCAMTHSLGTPFLGENMVRVGLTALKHLKIVGGISVIENGYEQLADVYVSRKEEIPETEPEILKRAIGMIPRIYLDKIDALVVFEQGKEISGTGMDPAIVGRPINRLPNTGPHVETLGVLRLTGFSRGNASGCGMADFISRRLRDAIDEEYTIINSLTGMKPFLANIPPTLATDKLVFQACVKAAGQIRPQDLKLAVVRSTRSLEEIWLSRAAWAAVSEPERVERLSDFENVPFDSAGMLQLFEAAIP